MLYVFYVIKIILKEEKKSWKDEQPEDLSPCIVK